MHYLDTSIFFFAMFKPKAEFNLSPKVQWMKFQSQSILKAIYSQNLEICFSILQLSEMNNIFKTRMSWIQLRKFVMGLISNPMITILPVSNSLYIKAIDKIPEMNMDANDITSYLLMKDLNIECIYSFDKHFRNISDIICLPEKIPEFSK